MKLALSDDSEEEESKFDFHKKSKNDKESKPYKKSIELLRKLNDEKKKLAKEMDIAVSSKMRTV